MVTKELKKLKRSELIDVIYQMKKKEQQLEEKVSALQEEIETNRIHLANAGSIADAAMSVTNVFSAAQKAADLYLREIACMKEETEKACAKRLEEVNKEIVRVLAEEERRHTALKERFQADYQVYQQLRAEIQRLKKCRANEDAEHGEEN